MGGKWWMALALVPVGVAACGDDTADGDPANTGTGTSTSTGSSTSTDTSTFTGTGTFTGTPTGSGTGTGTGSGTGTGTGVENTCERACDTCEEAHGYTGCCDGTILTYWDQGQLVTGDCGADGCGWDPNGSYYNCGYAGASPNADLPLSCGLPWADPLTECLPVNNSCAGFCGSPDPVPGSAPTCYCDTQCEGFGDCCADICDAGICDTDPQICPGENCACSEPAVTDPSCTNSDPTACVCLNCDAGNGCELTEDCVCPDCAADPVCSNVANCEDDGLCDPYLEGCACADCVNHPSCPNGAATCVAGPPLSWSCTPAYYDAGDGCDCDCDGHDPDCDVPGQALFCDETKAPAGTTCDANDECVFP